MRLLIPLLLAFAGPGRALECYDCLVQDGASCGGTCEGSFCYKASGIDSDRGQGMKMRKGCLPFGFETPPQCERQNITLPGFRVSQGFWCVCKGNYCNAAVAGAASALLVALSAFLH